MTVDEVIRNLELCRCNDRIRGTDNCPLCTITDGDKPDCACREVLMYEAEMALEKLKNRNKDSSKVSWIISVLRCAANDMLEDKDYNLEAMRDVYEFEHRAIAALLENVGFVIDESKD